MTAVFRYNGAGEWYKGNLHIHSTCSDGGRTFAELAALYAAAGYDFLARTDHWVASDTAADPARYPLLWLDGIELDGNDARGVYYHVLCVGRVSGIRVENGIEAAMAAVRSQGGMTFLAHPYWSGNSGDDANAHPFDGVEVYNHVCRWLNGKSEGGPHWHAVLSRNPAALGLAVDDAHIRREHPGWNGGWIHVQAPALDPPSVLAAIRRGHFYSSCGPEFLGIAETASRTVRVRTSPVRFARLVGKGWLGARLGTPDGELLTEATFTVPDDWPYACLEIEDDRGRRAWTNALYVPAPARGDDR